MNPTREALIPHSVEIAGRLTEADTLKKYEKKYADTSRQYIGILPLLFEIMAPLSLIYCLQYLEKLFPTS
jgi:hypothetical protein